METWAPPAPGSAAAVAPPPTIPALFAPTLPDTITPARVVAALPVTPIPDSSGSAQVVPAPVTICASPGADDPDAPADEAPRTLLGTRHLRIGVLATVGAASVTALLGSPFAAVIGGLAAVLLLAWCARAVENVRRSRPATEHHRPPRPVSSVLWWFAAPVVVGGGGVALVAMAEWVDRASFEQEGPRSSALVLAVVAVVLISTIAAYVPYGTLSRASRWVGGDSSKMRMWFGAPLMVALAAVTIRVLAVLPAEADAAAGGDPAGTWSAPWVSLASIALPTIAWMISGSRAMIDLEEATRSRHGRTVREAELASGAPTAPPGEVRPPTP